MDIKDTKMTYDVEMFFKHKADQQADPLSYWRGSQEGWNLAMRSQESKIKELESELEGYRTGMICAGGCR